MFVMCGICKNVINHKDVDSGKFVLKRALGNAYIPDYNCKNCISVSEKGSLYILENAYPVLKENCR